MPRRDRFYVHRIRVATVREGDTARPERRASQEEVCGAFPGTELRCADGNGGSPGEAEGDRRSATAALPVCTRGVAEGARPPWRAGAPIR